MVELTPSATITFVCGIIMCVIGVASFVTSMVNKARQEGVLISKVDTALSGIESIKEDIK